MNIQDQLDDFQQFVADHLVDGDQHTLDELYDMWRLENPTQEERADNVAAVKASLEDLKHGERGMPLDDHIDFMQQKHDLS